MPRLESDEQEDETVSLESSETKDRELDDGMDPLDQDGRLPELGSSVAPSLMSGSYNQTYIILDANAPGVSVVREVMFRCGNWCYAGEVSFAGLGEGITLADISKTIPMLQRQQGRLRFYCTSSAIPDSSPFVHAARMLESAQDFMAAQLSSDALQSNLLKWSNVFPWIEEGGVYFELTADVEKEMEGVTLVASKTYSRGLILISVFFEGSFYVVLQDGEGDQALLDIRFPDVSSHGQGLHLTDFREELAPWRKITLWQSLGGNSPYRTRTKAPRSPTRSLASDRYIQTYVVMQPNRGGSAANAIYRDVLFRFGSWCYAGTVQLTPMLALSDVPHVIPALRMQQSRLDFVFDVRAIPERTPYSKPLNYLSSIVPAMEEEIIASEEVLTSLLDKLDGMGLASSVEEWFDGQDGAQSSFFEFKVAPDEEYTEAFRGVDLVASKAYSPQGVVLITIWFQGIFYVVLSDGTSEQPLLDSRFPDVSSKGRGYQVRGLPDGRDDWPQLRKVSVWQTAAALQATVESAAAAGTPEEALLLDEELEAVAAADPKVQDAGESKSRELAEEDTREVAQAKGAETKQGEGTASMHPTSQEKTSSPSPSSSATPGSQSGFLAAKPLTKTRVAMPHHIAPLAKDSLKSTGLESRLERMREELGGNSGSAPWDEFGNPKLKGALSGSKEAK